MAYGDGLYGAGTYGSNIRMSYSSKRNEIFIGKGGVTYILSDKGMYSISGQIDGIVYRNSEELIHSQSAIVQSNLTDSTDIINFKSQGLKALEWINLNIDCPEDIFVTVRYRDSVKVAFTSAPQKQFNTEGVCRIGVRGVDFILDFSIPSYTTLQLASMKLGVQFIDRRFRRGVNVEDI